MGDCPDEREAKARKKRDVFTVTKNPLGKRAALWSCTLALPAGKRGTMLVALRVIVDAEGHLTRPSISVSLEPPF